LVARFVRDEEAAGSNPVTPTSSGAVSATSDRLLSAEYGSEVQQRPSSKGLPQSLERVPSLLGRDLGVDLHRHGEVSVAKDLHRDAWVYVEVSEQRRAGPPSVMHSDPPNRGLGAAGREHPVDVRGSTGVPSLPVKTKPSACQAAPAVSRSVDCRSARSRSAVTHNAGSGSVASEASVLVSRRSSSRRTSCTCQRMTSSPPSRSTSSRAARALRPCAGRGRGPERTARTADRRLRGPTPGTPAPHRWSTPVACAPGQTGR
jgi:hypothetical protein